MEEDIRFQSYSWALGTTSFRVSELNYKIEKQLSLLKQFWKENPNKIWNSETQTQYYYFMKDNEFISGNAPRPDKDAREKTSGLVDIGVLNSDRHLTEVGTKIESLLDEELNNDNIFQISEDSYYYLLQFLKLQLLDGDIKLKPFIALIYMIEKRGYITYDEFIYLLPLCKNASEVKEIVEILNTTSNIDIDKIIIEKIFSMSNYVKAFEYFEKTSLVEEKTFEIIGINRKSRAYDKAYYKVFNCLYKLVFEQKNNDFDKKLPLYKELFESCEKISGNARKMWKDELFFGYRKQFLNIEFENKFNESEFANVKDINEFKRLFFTKMHLFKWKVNLKEYFDLNKRYFSLTDIVKFGEEKIELELLPKYYFEDIIDDLLNEPLLDKDSYITLFNKYVNIEDISNKCNKTNTELVDTINKDLNISLNENEIKDYIENEKIKEFNALIDKKFRKEQLLIILDWMKNRNDTEINNYVTDNATVSTIFEYILGIIWYRISGKKGNILKFMRLSLDANLLPKSHATGGMADIVYKYDSNNDYPEHDLLIEATLSESTGQRVMEMEPVSRHLGENIKITNNEKDYALFIAPDLEERVVLDFRSMRTRFYPKGNDEYINGLKIIPINIDILKYVLINNMTYSEIYTWFERAYVSNIPDPIWFQKEILNNIK